MGLGRVKTFSCKRSELDEVATRAIFPDFDYALIAAISGSTRNGSPPTPNSVQHERTDDCERGNAEPKAATREKVIVEEDNRDARQ
jgi:hypothetical protein